MKLFYLLPALIFSIAFQSCDNKEEDSYADWKKENDAHIADIKSRPAEYFEVSITGGPGSVYCKKIPPEDKNEISPAEYGNGTYPLYTSKVDIRYRGKLIKTDKFFEDASERITSFNVNGVVKGFAIALQRMQVGEKWEVNIPWELGYGSYGKDPVPPYSALIYELELVGISEF